MADLLVRDCRAEDAARLQAIQAAALNLPSELAAAWFDALGPQAHRVVEVDGVLQGGLAVVLDAQYFGGRAVGCGCVAAVAVAPHLRGRGVGRALMADALRRMAADGVPLSTLYPSSFRFYRSAGYERAGASYVYEVPLWSLPAGAASHDLAPVEDGDGEAQAALCRVVARSAAGTLARTNPFLWRRHALGREGDGHAYKAVRGGTLEGFVVYTVRRAEAELQVVSFCAANGEAAAALLGFMRGHGTMFRSMSWRGGPRDPLVALLPERTYRIRDCHEWMTRVVDVRQALTERGYPRSVAAEVHLTVRDDVLAANDGRWILRVEGGEGTVERGGDGRLALDVRALAPLFTGALSAGELAARGHLDGGLDDVETAGAVFAGPAPFLSLMF